MLSPYGQLWLEHVSRTEKKAYLMHVLKQGVELLLLVCSYLFYYLTDCVAQVMTLPTIH